MIVVDNSDGLTIEKVKVILNFSANSTLTDAADGLTVFGGAVSGGTATNSTGDVTVSNDATLTISQSANANGASWRAGNLIVNGATVDFNKANSTGALTVDLDNATLKFTNPNSTPGNIKGTADNSTIVATGALSKSLNLYQMELKNTTVTTDGDLGLYEGQTVTMDTTSSIKADKVYPVNSSAESTPTITGGSVKADVTGSTDVSSITLNETSVDGTVTPDVISGTSGYNLNGVDIANGEKVYSGAIRADTVVESGAVLVDLTVNPGVTLTIDGNATVKGTMRLYGTLAPKDDAATIAVDTEASLTAYNGSNIAKGMAVTGEGDIDLSAAMSTVTLNDDIESDFTASQTQKVVIADTLTIKTGYTMTVLGELIINEGCTVIIEDGAYLTLGDANVKATGMTVNGSIDIEAGGSVEVKDAKEVTVVGSITSEGTVTINSTVSIKDGGSIKINDYENSNGNQMSSIEVSSGLTVEKGGELYIAADMKITTISNMGTIVLNGAKITDSSKVNMAADGAVLEIKSMTQAAGSDLTVTDLGMYLYTDKDGTKHKIEDGAQNNLFFSSTGTTDVGIRNMVIVASLTSEVIDKQKVYSNTLLISGSPSIYDNTDAASYTGNYTIAARGNGGIQIADSLTLGKNVQFTLSGGTMNVDGSMTATAEGSKIVSNGNIYVSGMITTDISSPISRGINAFQYADDDCNYYTTLKTSIDNKATDIRYYGNVSVLDTLTVPADVQITKANGQNGIITVGDEDNRDTVLTIADGATVRTCTINVMGTLVFDNNKTGNRSNPITSDVVIDAEPKRTYTNIYTALDDAADNSTVTIARNIFLDKDAEIRQTITLDVPAAYGIYLDDDVTLSVNGVLRNSGSVGAAVEGESNAPVTTGMAGFNPETEDHSEIVVKGSIMSMNALDYGTYYIVGAYYQLIDDQGSWYYITPVEQAAAVSNDVEDGEIVINGAITIGDVAFTGDTDEAVAITVNGDLIAGTITLKMAGMDIEGSFTGKISSAVGTVDVTNSKEFQVVDTTVGTDDKQTTYLNGTPVAADEDKDSKVVIADGTINAGQITITADGSDFSISEKATLMVAGEYDGDASEVAASEMTVHGTLVATDGGIVDVDVITIRGTFTVDAEDRDAGTSAGKAEITTMFVGIAKKTDRAGITYFVDSSAASVSADEISGLKTMYVSAESTVSGKLTDSLANTTEFYVEDTLWMTIYTTETNTPINDNLQPGDLVNSQFNYWIDDEGEIINASNPVDVGDVDKVSASLDYNIYTITVFADPGITAVYVDGKLMSKGYFSSVDSAGNIQQIAGFQLKVAAGNHEITYKLNNYFSGEAKMTVNGTSVNGNTFTTSGTTTSDKAVTIYLQGIEASAPDTPSNGSSSDDGMGLTDYLLIVLVVLIVIMAIMVALRMMRS